jgi:UPF0271 protein
MAYVLDASAIINNASFYFGEEKYYITARTFSEIREGEKRMLMDEALDRKNLTIMEPSKGNLEKIRKEMEKTGDRLSVPDIETLALAYELKLPLITDDYGMQNVASCLKIKVLGGAEPGIKKVWKWAMVCQGCKRKYKTGKVCTECGSKLVRKPLG